MKKQRYLFYAVLCAGLMMSTVPANANEKASPMADSGKMMLEHIGMDCTICHGESGPKGFKMGNHPKQMCTDCHAQGTTKPIAHKEKRTSLAKEMMLKHGAKLQCKLCHGENPSGGMMMEHIGMDCQTCHFVAEK